MLVKEYDGPLPNLGPRTPKPPGDNVGVTRIVRSIMQQEYPDRYGDGAPDPARVALGFAWEEILSGALRDADRDAPADGAALQQALTRDKIVGVVDRLLPLEWIVEEYKATYASSRRAIDDPFFSYWHMQGAAYCYLAESDTCRYRVLFINGDYTHPYTPEWVQADITWTAAELRENWHALVEHATAKGWLETA